MERISQIAIVLVTASSLALAQTPVAPPGRSGARAGDQQAQAQDGAARGARPAKPRAVAQPGQEGQPAAAQLRRRCHRRRRDGAPQPSRVRPAAGIDGQAGYVHFGAHQPGALHRSQPGGRPVHGYADAAAGGGRRGGGASRQTVYGNVADVKKQHSDKPSQLKLELTSFTLADGTQVAAQTQLVARQGGTRRRRTSRNVAGRRLRARPWRCRGLGPGAPSERRRSGGRRRRRAAHTQPSTVIYPETALTFQMTAPFTISTTRAPQAFRYVGPDDYDHRRCRCRPARGARPPASYYGRLRLSVSVYYGYGYRIIRTVYGPQWASRDDYRRPRLGAGGKVAPQ